ncbi:hypothetical protein MMC22_001076 [Lobaria immixta]|nr:hypothetical protein [Lobaria immixta]
MAQILQSFDHKVTTNLLLKAAKTHPSVASLIQEERLRQIALQQVEVLNFDQFSESAWDAVNVRYAKLSCSHQFDAAPEAISQIVCAIESVCNRCTQHASYASKMNALEALRQIGESVFPGTEVIGREVRKRFGSGMMLAKAMEGILYKMSQGQWEKVKRAGWVKQLEEFVELAESHDTLKGLRKVVDLLRERDVKNEEESGGEGGEEGGQEGGEEDESHEEEYEDEEESEVTEDDESEDDETREAREIEELKTFLLARAIIDEKCF